MVWLPADEERPPGIADLRVLSLGTAIAGNVTAMTLAELGADVVKIESPARPDPLRVQVYADQPRTVEPAGAETNIMFAGYARSVRGITIDMKDPEGQETFARLLAEADVLIDNFAAGVMDRFGFTRGRLAEINRRLVHLSVSGYGRTGPRSHYMAYGSNRTGSAFSDDVYVSNLVPTKYQGVVEPHDLVLDLGDMAVGARDPQPVRSIQRCLGQ